MKKLYLLRHGQTEFNVKKLVQGRCDSPLTELGRKQACGSRMAQSHDVVPDKVVSSPLGRAMDTASLVAPSVLGRLQQSSPAKASSSVATAPSKKAPTTPCPPTSGTPARTWSLRRRRKPGLQERMVGTLYQYHGRRWHRNPPSSKPRQRQPPIHQGCSPRGLRAPSKTPQLRHHDLQFR